MTHKETTSQAAGMHQDGVRKRMEWERELVAFAFFYLVKGWKTAEDWGYIDIAL